MGIFVHAGMKVCDISHVVPLFGNMTDGYFMDCDEQRCTAEGFAGMVLLATDDIVETPNRIIANPASRNTSRNNTNGYKFCKQQ